MKNYREMITILQHGPDEGPGIIPAIFREKSIPHEIVRLYEGEDVPATSGSGFIILGGQMSVNDEREYPFLAAEKTLIRSSMKEGNRVLGLCLGAQLIASAMGSQVFPSPCEQGWCWVTRTGETPPGFPKRPFVFQWHNETFDLPPGSRLIYSGANVRNQGFMNGSCLGVQFHPEVTAETIDRWTHGFPGEETYRMRQETRTYFPGSAEFCRSLLGLAFQGVGIYAP